MRGGRFAVWLFLAMLLVVPTHATLNDLDINLRHPFEQFAKSDGVFFLDNALAEVALGRYVAGSDHQKWRGGVSGDVTLVSSKNVLWHMSLAEDTLGDDQNDIGFRLLMGYFQALTGVKWMLGP